MPGENTKYDFPPAAFSTERVKESPLQPSQSVSTSSAPMDSATMTGMESNNCRASTSIRRKATRTSGYEPMNPSAETTATSNK